MKIVGWIAWDTGKDEPYAAAYQGTRKLYRTESIARGAIGPKRRERGIAAIPVYAHDVPPEPKA